VKLQLCNVLFTSAIKVKFHLHLSVQLLTGLLKIYRSNFYESLCNGWTRTIRLDFDLLTSCNLDLESMSLEVRRSESFFANNFVQNCRRELRQKLKCSSFISLNTSEYD